MSTSVKEPPLKLLALDGGGIRGLSELLIIKEVMHGLMVEENAKREKEGRELLSEPPKPCDYFDLIGGTSTGGIIALMLGRLRMDVESAITHYDNLAKEVFSSRKLWGDGKFKATKLEEAVKLVVRSITGDSESPLLDGENGEICRTFVCAKNAVNMGIPVRFRTYPSRETHINCTIWEAARATSAAPTFFKRILIGRDQPYVDGGLGYNNPCQTVLDEARVLFGDRQIGCLVSVGTGQVQVIAIGRPVWFQQAIPTNVIEALKAITNDCEKTHRDMLDRFAKLPNTYFRLNVEQGMQGIELSEWEKLSSVEAHTVQYMKEREVQEKLASLVSVIQMPRAQVTLEQLISPHPLIDLVVQQSREHKLCPPPVESFVGRRDILDQMHLYFRLNSTCQCTFILHGLGGSGKSQLAFKFVEESTQFSDVFYVDATNEQTLQTDLESIAPENVERSVDESLCWLASQAKNSQWLLLFDNADKVDLKLNKYFPSRCGNILITTRNVELRTYAGKGGDAKVGDMDHEDAKNLLLYQARAEPNDENKVLADAIVKELYYFALAISQAGAYIHCHSSLKGYLGFYLCERDHLLDEVQFQNQDPYAQAVYATWKLSYDRLDTLSKSFLQICSLLHHEGISEKMFERATLSKEQLEDSELQDTVNDLLLHLGKQKLDSESKQWDSWGFQNHSSTGPTLEWYYYGEE
ncbi:FabD/lysophospholipase-like protein [Pholiota conissans]|uniref:FabD/lysophospholipase-like protein n=1 Tax=Pholiota conissans TaxID=109636 RepID=A0A9P6CPN7_9AGAR|nr:FabD/lysophospholipase-like protein [Pholiota conissans]